MNEEMISKWNFNTEYIIKFIYVHVHASVCFFSFLTMPMIIPEIKPSFEVQ